MQINCLSIIKLIIILFKFRIKPGHIKFPAFIYILFFFVLLYVTAFNNLLNASEPASIFFYNPDANIQNAELLIKSFTDYFKPVIPNFKIQPFINIETMINTTLTKGPGFLIIPYWNYQLLLKDKSFNPLGLEGILTPMVNSNVCYKKIIVVKNNSGINDIAGISGKVASTSIGLQGVDFLTEFLFQDKLDLKKINFVWTNKDMDAILALKFNQSQASIISDKTFNETKKTQAQLVSDFKILKESKDIPEVVLLCLRTNIDDKLKDEIKKMFLDMNNSENGKKILKILNYDQWVDIK